MARKTLGSTNPLNESNNAKIAESIIELLATHAEEIDKGIQDSDDKSLVVNFAVEIDCKESAPAIDVKCRFTPCTVTDKRTLRCDDPAQGTLNIYTAEEIAKKEDSEKKAAEKMKKEAEKAAEKKAKKKAEGDNTEEGGE